MELYFRKLNQTTDLANDTSEKQAFAKNRGEIRRNLLFV